MIPDKPRKSQFTGCLIGQCLGDALGMPAEGANSRTCRRYLDEEVSRWFKGQEPPAGWTGQYTDDSQLARELLESLVVKSGFDPEDYSFRIAAIFDESRIVGQGLATAVAAQRLSSGIHWKQAGEPSPSAGNGTAMRVAPIGLYYWNDLEQLSETAHLQGWITHQDCRCSAGSVAIASTISFLLSRQTFNTADCVDFIATAARPYHTEFAELLRQLKEWIKFPPEEAIEYIGPAGRALDFREDGWPGISPFVVPSVLWSLYAFLRHPDDYWRAIHVAIGAGGDVDTTAAMTGAVSGAWVGLEELPSHLTGRLNDMGTWRYSELIDLSERCYHSVTSN
jgi:ADP-ribosylglycohydrolase